MSVVAIKHYNQFDRFDPRQFYQRGGRILAAQTAIYHQGDEIDGFFRVNSGVVMVYRLLEDSQRQISGFYTAGDFFGLTGEDEHQDSAIAVATSNVVHIPNSVIESCPELQKELFYQSRAQLNAAQTLITTLTKKTASEKVAQFLVDLASRHSVPDADFDLRLPMSRLDIADYLGLTIETVSRRLTCLKSEGVISLPDRNTATILDFDRLRELAGAR